MSNTESPQQYPIACPSCDELQGYPYQVRTVSDRRGSIEVRLRCRECQHEWVQVVESPA